MKRPRFSLRELMLVVAVCASAVAWRVIVVRQYREDRINDIHRLLPSLEKELSQTRPEALYLPSRQALVAKLRRELAELKP
jgi:hypothetical protein